VLRSDGVLGGRQRSVSARQPRKSVSATAACRAARRENGELKWQKAGEKATQAMFRAARKALQENVQSE